MLEIIVFICGAVVMILELVGSRVLAPYVGTSIIVWTSLIGIILGSLSLGYWWGGRIADNKQDYRIFSMIIFISAISVGMITLLKSFVLDFLQNNISDIHINAIIATLVLFALPSVLLGMITPYAVRLKINDLQSSGKTVGSLYAISTIGSIAGTFLAGFFLIAYFGSSNILLVLSIILVFTSLLAYFKNIPVIKIIVILLLLISIIAVNSYNKFMAKQGFVDIDTRYNRIWIYKSVDEKTNRPTLNMLTNPKELQSAMFLDNDNDLVIEYTKYYRLAQHFRPDLKKALMIGGAGCSYPKDYLKKFADAGLDVVEIDPMLTELAKQYFNLKDDTRLRIFREDGRTFLNRTKNRYDVIFGDAFSSYYSLPYQLTTREAIRKMHEALNDDGVVLVNIISAIDGEKGRFLRAEYATFRDIFPQVYLFPVKDFHDGLLVQNIMLVAIKSDQKPSFRNSDPELNGYLQHLWKTEIKKDVPILTDDYAPVDNYMMKIIKGL
ncbi:MAG: spermidine synthase [Nitrospira sp.]|nr:spermidine synthase [Nitrospira sp.]